MIVFVKGIFKHRLDGLSWVPFLMPSKAFRKISGGNAPRMISSFSVTIAGMDRISNRRASVIAVSRRSWQWLSLNASLSFSGVSLELNAISRITSRRPMSLRSVKKARKTFSYNASNRPMSRANSPAKSAKGSRKNNFTFSMDKLSSSNLVLRYIVST